MTTPTPGLPEPEKAIRDALALGPLKGVWTAERDFSQWRISNAEQAKNRAPRRVAGVGSPGRLKTSKLEAENAATAHFIAACNPANITALLAEIERLRADAAGWTPDDNREFQAIGLAVNRAAADLPQGTRVRIDLEKDAGTVYWIGAREGGWQQIDGGGEPFSEQISTAIEAAKGEAP